MAESRDTIAFQRAILEALGLQDRAIIRLTMTLRPFEPVQIEFEEAIIDPKNSSAVSVRRVLEMATWTQREAVTTSREVMA